MIHVSKTKQKNTVTSVSSLRYRKSSSPTQKKTTLIEMTELILKTYNFGWRMAANKSDTDTDLTKNVESKHFYL